MRLVSCGSELISRQPASNAPARMVRALIAVMTLLTCLGAWAQGVHISLRSNLNPFPQHRRYSEVWVDGNYAYLGSDAASGVLIIDISNPDAPFVAANYAPANSADMEDIKVSNGIGYFASNALGGLHIVDLSDPTHPKQLARITSAQGGYDQVHNVAVDGNYVYFPNYGVGGTPAIQIWDVSNPAQPVHFMTFMTTDPITVHDLSVKNGRLYTSGWGGHTDIWDITNVSTVGPVLLGTILTGNRAASTAVTDDGNYLFGTRELTTGGTLSVYNISDPANPSLMATFNSAQLGLDSVSPFQPKVVGDLLYVSWDQAGVTVFDISDPTSPLLIGNYDTWPAAPISGSFDGNWGVCPDLGPDRVVLSDRDTGLYIVDATGVSSQPALLNFKVNPSTVVGSVASQGQVFVLGRPGPGGFTVNLSSNKPAATPPPTAVVSEGSNSATFSIPTSPVASNTTVTLTASDGTYTRTANLVVKIANLNSVTFTPKSVVGGSVSGTGTVKFSTPVGADTVVTLAVTNGASAVASIPSSVTVPNGATTATFSVGTNPVASNVTVTVSATANGTKKSGSLTVTPLIPSSLTFTPKTGVGPFNSTGKVVLAAKALTDTVVTLGVVTGASVVNSIPGTVTVPANSNTGTFVIQLASVDASTSVQVSATLNGTTKIGALTVNPNTPTGFTFTPNSVTGGASSTGKVTFSKAVLQDTVITLSVISGSGAIASIPATVTIPQGSSSKTFTVTTNPVGSQTIVQVSATANGGSRTGSLTVN